MADRFVILKASAVMNEPTCGTMEDAIDGAQKRCSVDGEDRVVAAIVFEISSSATVLIKAEG